MANILDRIAQQLRPWHPTDEQFQHVAAKIGYEPPAEAVAAIRELQTKFDRAYGRLEELGHSRAIDLASAQSKLARDIAEGKKSVPAAGVGFLSKDQFRERIQAERTQLKAVLRSFGLEAVKIARPVVAQFCDACEKAAQQAEMEEFAKLDSMAIPHRWQSALAAGLRRVAKAADDHLRSDDQILLCRPQSFLPFVKF